MNDVSQLSHAFIVFISAIFTQNILLSYFLGFCPFIGVSREIKTSFGLGLAVIFVMTSTCLLNWLAYQYVRLRPWQRHRLVPGYHRNGRHPAETCQRPDTQRPAGSGYYPDYSRFNGIGIYRIYRRSIGKLISSSA